ncbi:MAG: amino acid ABC transporter permease [Candidatus Bipolaricaulia bacterium]
MMVLRLLRWLRENLFSTWYNTLLTVLSVWVLWVVLSGLFQWAVRDAVWSGGAEACQQARQLAQAEGRPWGACWTVIPENLKLFLTGTYPAGELWRIWVCVYIGASVLGVSAGVWRGLVRDAAIALGAAAIVLLLLPFSWAERLWIGGIACALWVPMGVGWFARPRIPPWALIGGWLALPALAVWLIGGGGPLPKVETIHWGGLMLTFLLAVVGIVASFPLGVLLALGRQSSLPLVRWFSILYIEIVRGVPLITLIFMASLMLPLFLPGNIRIDQALRAMTAFTLFTAAYIAENVRGGLQAIPRGQIEAAQALGLSAWLTTFFIILPQALRAVIPANVGQFISLFKDTSLVFVAALLDLFNMGRSILANPQWLGSDREVLLFVAFVYWVFTYTMAHLSRRLERILGVGER